VVLSGEVTLELDDEAIVTLGPGGQSALRRISKSRASFGSNPHGRFVVNRLTFSFDAWRWLLRKWRVFQFQLRRTL
jgi:hypothetical protein